MLQRGRYNASVSSLPPALVVDTREWFLDEAWRAHVAPRHWRRLPPRADVALQRAVKVLTSSGARATFLIPAALATRAAGLLADVVAAGHEVALSVRSPQPLDEVPEAERARFVDAWREERAALEAAIGRGIHGFAAVWPIQEPAALPWWRAALREVGFAYDATPIAGREQEVVALDGKTGRARRFASATNPPGAAKSADPSSGDLRLGASAPHVRGQRWPARGAPSPARAGRGRRVGMPGRRAWRPGGWRG